jgi:hypothetical protein
MGRDDGSAGIGIVGIGDRHGNLSDKRPLSPDGSHPGEISRAGWYSVDLHPVGRRQPQQATTSPIRAAAEKAATKRLDLFCIEPHNCRRNPNVCVKELQKCRA